jgi:hypothetical protein
LAPTRLVASIALVSANVAMALVLEACNKERKDECDALLVAMAPLSQGEPTGDTVDRVDRAVRALDLKDQPLHIYADNYQKTLTVLSSTLQLGASPSAPDGTDDVIKTHLKEARTDRADVERYCAQ